MSGLGARQWFKLLELLTECFAPSLGTGTFEEFRSCLKVGLDLGKN